jgi:hypothetical protein
MSSESVTSDVTDKEKHELLYDTLKSTYWKSIEFEFKEAGILLIIIGWLFTAQRAQEFIASSISVRLIITVVILLFTAFHAFYVTQCFRRSLSTIRQLHKLAYMPQDYYESVRFPKLYAISFCLLHSAAALAIVVIVWLLPALVEPI